MERRPYRQKVRAERQAATRQRIVEATVDLHSTVGPARTSISAVAERAGVQRHTVYAHFPDEATLFAACSSLWRGQHPFPDLNGLEFPAALDRVYGWFEEVETAFALFRRDAALYPGVWAERERALREVADRLAAPLGRRKLLRAAVGHATAFDTWRSLVRTEGLTRRQAVDAMVAFVAAA